MFESLRGRTPISMDEDEYKKYAVMIPLVEKDGRIYVLFEVRAGSLRRQPGEICFPGGKREKGETAEENAVRETAEELDIDFSQVRVIAPMDYLLTMYDVRVDPVLGQLLDYEMTFSRDEVDEVFLVPLDYFMENDPEVYYNRIYVENPDDFPFDDVPGGRKYYWASGKKRVFFYYYEDRIIWGLTAYIMQGAVKLLKETGYGKKDI